MASLTTEQIQEKKLLIAEKLEAIRQLREELLSSGDTELTDEDLANVGGGIQAGFFTEGGVGEWGKRSEETTKPRPRFF